MFFYTSPPASMVLVHGWMSESNVVKLCSIIGLSVFKVSCFHFRYRMY